MPSRTSRKRGYTLVEVLVTVTILGIMGVLVIPSLDQTGILKTHAAVRTVISDLTYAQSDALAYQEGRAILFDADTNSYTLIGVTGTTIDPATDALFNAKGPNQRYEVTLNDPRYGGSHFENIDFNNGSLLVFDEMGGPVAAPSSTDLSTGGTVDIVGGDGTRYRLTISAFTGRIRVSQIEDAG